ncbi:MAG: hypothetical protein WAV31_04540 [Candidatus Moraniibacteriota bacterium]
MNNWKEKVLRIFKKDSVRSGLFCGICKKEKNEKFCKYCKKETPDNRVVRVPTLKIKATFNEASFKIRRGKESFDFFIVAFNVLATLLIAVISISDIQSIYKIILIFFSIFGSYYLCFKGPHSRNLIVGFFMKAKEHEDKI